MNIGLSGLRKVAGMVLLLGATGAVAATGIVNIACHGSSPIRYSFDVFPSPMQRGEYATLTLGISNSDYSCFGHVSSSQSYSSDSVWTGTSGVFSSGDGQEIQVTNVPRGPLSVSFQYDNPGFYQPSFVGTLLHRVNVRYSPAYPGGPYTYFGFNNLEHPFSASAPLEVSLIPEPETYTMMLGGLGLVGWVLRRRTPQPSHG